MQFILLSRCKLLAFQPIAFCPIWHKLGVTERPHERTSKTGVNGCPIEGAPINVFLIIDDQALLIIMRNTMPSPAPTIASNAADTLSALGKQIRAHRKALRISATSTAEAAGISRVTLHRIENGELSVTMGAYLNAIAALGLNFGIINSANPERDTHV